MTDFSSEILMEEDTPELAPKDKSEDQLRQGLPPKTSKENTSKVDNLQSIAGNTVLLQQAEASRRERNKNDKQSNFSREKPISQAEKDVLNSKSKDPQDSHESNTETAKTVEKLDPDTENERVVILAQVAVNLSDNPQKAPLGAMFALYRDAPKVQVERAAKTFMSVFLRTPADARLASRKAINTEMKNYAETLLVKILRTRLGQIVTPPATPPPAPPPSPGGGP